MVDGVFFLAVWIMDEFSDPVMFLFSRCLGVSGDGRVNQDVSEVFVPSVCRDDVVVMKRRVARLYALKILPDGLE